MNVHHPQNIVTQEYLYIIDILSSFPMCLTIYELGNGMM